MPTVKTDLNDLVKYYELKTKALSKITDVVKDIDAITSTDTEVVQNIDDDLGSTVINFYSDRENIQKLAEYVETKLSMEVEIEDGLDHDDWPDGVYRIILKLDWEDILSYRNRL